MKPETDTYYTIDYSPYFINNTWFIQPCRTCEEYDNQWNDKGE